MLDTLVEAARAAERAGTWDEALSQYERALAYVEIGADPSRVADILRWIATVHRGRGDLELALEACEASLEIARAGGLPERTVSALNSLAAVKQLCGELDEAERLYREARARAMEIGSDELLAMVVQNLGTLANIRGDLPSALRQYQAALNCYRRLGDERSAAWALNNLGMAQVDAGEWERADGYFAEALALAERQGDADTRANVLANRAELHLRRGDTARARECCDGAFELYTRLQAKPGLAECYKIYGVLHRETGEPSRSEMHFLLGLELARLCGDRLLEAETEGERAALYLRTGQHREALRSLDQARRLFADMQARREVLDVERRLRQLEELYLELGRTWGERAEARDPLTVGHCERVAKHACALAAAVGVPERELTWFRMGALLHDVGKSAVPEAVLNKPGPLTPEEWAEVRDHPLAGDRIVAELGFPVDIRPLVRSHHEHWDGSGYPDGLTGEDIPLPARILAVADVYDALTSARSYRPAFRRDDALRVLQGEAGRVLDPYLVRTFRGLVGDG